MNTTPYLADAIASIENAETFITAADRGEEAPTPVLALAALRLRHIRETLEFSVRRPS